jgi:uncharacterized protein YlaI
MSRTAKERSAKQWANNKANAYPCPDCGRVINKTTVYRHNESYFHKYNVLLKITIQHSS